MNDTTIHHDRARLGSACGATLVETLFVAVVMAVVVGAVGTAMMTAQRASISSEMYVVVQQQARQALANMTNELRQARPGAANLIIAQIVPDQSESVTFQVGQYDSGTGNMMWGAPDQQGAHKAGWFLRYRLNGSIQLVRDILDEGGNLKDGSGRVLAHYARLLDFTYNTQTHIVVIRLAVQQLSAQLPGGQMGASPQDAPLVTQVKLRNTIG
ncbi:MAG: hypothetical protein HY737_04260 [Candidatus Omnitrophica bacterium]|nr:hypothetical protein [Candidatus Omnitrophota bacterium]